ncbi:MAG: glycosyltransferase [Clostridiales bacterium]|nr:glycosyltransferase [Clostridiales bacterium]
MDRKLKVAIGTDAFPPTTDGISNVAQSYAYEINKNLGEAVVVTPKNPNQLDYRYDYQIYRYKSWWVPTKEGYSIGWPFDDRLHQDIIDMNFDILHSHAPLATSYYFRRVVEKKKIPTVLTYHTKYEYDIDRRVPTKPVKDFAYHFLCNNINAADEVWVTSNGTADSLRKLGYEGDYILIPNGCDLPITNVSSDDVAIIKRKHSIPEGLPVFIYIGRMIWYKNIDLILNACRKIADDGMDFRMIMLGFGADENAIKKKINKLNLKKYIIWTGKTLDRKELLGYYSISDLLLFPSTFDTNGLVVREAAACATPSLLVRDSCAAEGIDDCKTGFLCMESYHSIAVTIEKIVENPVLIKDVGKNAQKDIYISWEDAVRKAYERYHIVIDNFNSKGK